MQNIVDKTGYSMSLRNLIANLLILFLSIAPGLLSASSENKALLEKMRTGVGVLMIRHALAPGIGDPDEFQLGDCSTQRNLNETGRKQARSIGEWLRLNGINRARVYSSQWCRCMETAKLINLGEVTPLPALNSFFDRPEDREKNLAALGLFLKTQSFNGVLTILVTHQVTISAVTGKWTDSGHGKLVAPQADGSVKLLGEITFGE